MSVTINDEPRIIEWLPGSTSPFLKMASLQTDDKDLIAAIKARPEYGTLIVDDEEAVSEEKVDPISIEEVTTIQQAKEVLVKEYDIPASKIPNKTAILNAASKLNIVFPNLVD